MPWQVYNSAGQLLQATDLPDNAVTNAKVADDAIDSAELAAGSVDTAHIAGSQITNALMADDAIGVAELSATGTASSSTFLRGDNAWAAATTSFIGVRVENSSNQSVSNNSVAKLTFDASVTKFDTDTMHSSGNADRITFTTAGYYWCGLSYMWTGHATGRRNVWVSSTLIAGGGTTLVRQTISPSTGDEQHNVINFIYQFAAGDFIEWYAHQTSGTSLNIHADNESSAVAMAYKIG
jgi:hypothetical protein